MAHTSVKITADADAYKAQMKTAAEQMKKLSSEYNLAATKAKLFGSETDSLKAKAESLTQKINVQNNIVKMSREEQERLTKKLDEQKGKREELKAKIDAAQKAYEAEKKATGASSDASKALKEELDKLNKQYETNEGAISRSESALTKQTVTANKAETELVEMEAELKNVNEQLAETNEQLESSKLDDFADACQSAGEKMESFGSKMMGVTKGIAAIAKESVKSYSDVKTGMDAVTKATGATGEALEDLQQSFKNVAVSFSAEFEDIGSALGEVNTRFGFTGEAAESCTKKFLEFARINNTDATTSVQLVSRAMGDAGIEASEYEKMLDQLSVAAQASGISIDSLTGYITKYGAPMRALGFDTQSSIAIFAGWEKAGVNTEIAFSGMKNAISKWSSEGKYATEEFGKTLNKIAECPTIAEATAEAIEVFGKKAGPDLADAIKGGRFEYSEFVELLKNSEGTVETTYNNLTDVNDDAKIAMNNVKIALGELGDTMLTGAAPIVKELTGKIQELTKWFTSLDKGQQQTIIKVGLVVAAVGPLAVGFGKVAKGISSTVEMGKHFVSGAAAIIGKITGKAAAMTADSIATGIATAAQTAFNLALKACPVIAVIAGITALIAVGVLLYKNWDTIKEKATELWKVIKEKFGKIKEDITDAFHEAKEAADKKMKEIREAIEKTPVGKAALKVFDGVRDTIKKMSDAATETVKQNLSNMEKAYKDNGGGIKGTVAAAWEGIKGYYTSGFTFIDNLTDGTLSRVKDKFGTKMHGAYEKVKQAIDKIKDVFDFEWKLPDIKLPHFKVTGKFSLSPPSAPKFSIQWYKTGAIMNSPMIFGMHNNTLLAGGEPETGGEAILPLAPFYTKLNDMLDKKLAAVQQTQNIYLESHTYIDGEEISNRTVSKVDAKMVQNRRKGR